MVNRPHSSPVARRALQIIKSEMEGKTQKQVADSLGVVSAHIYRLRNESYLSPTLKRAMVDAGLLVVNRRSPRISIQRDDPAAAAKSIIGLAGKETAIRLAKELVYQVYGHDVMLYGIVEGNTEPFGDMAKRIIDERRELFEELGKS